MGLFQRALADLREVGDPLHVRTLAVVLGAVVIKDLLAVDVLGYLIVPPGRFHMAWCDWIPTLPFSPELVWTTRVLTVAAFLFAIALLHARRGAAAALLVVYGIVFAYDATQYTNNVFLLLILLGVCALAPLRAPSVLWPRRLGQVTITAMYLGAGLAKLDPHFLSGAVLEQSLFHYFGVYAAWFGWRSPQLFQACALLSVVMELGLGLALWREQSAVWVALLGALFHVAIELLMPVRMFSYLVIASYLLFLPASSLARASVLLERHIRPSLRVPACLLLGFVLDLHHYGVRPFSFVACMLAYALYLVFRARFEPRAVPSPADLPPPRSVLRLRSAGPVVVVAYSLLQLFAVAKPWFGFSKHFSWRMFSEVLLLRLDVQLERGGGWKRAVFPRTQQRWSLGRSSYHWTSLGEEKLYLQGYARWLTRSFPEAGRLRLVVTYAQNGAPPQRMLIEP